MRNDLLSQAWTGAPLTLGGREINLSIGKYMLLESWHNPLFPKASRRTTTQPNYFSDVPTGHGSLAGLTDRDEPSQIEAMGELILVMYSNRQEIKEIQRMTIEKRREAVLEFIIDHDDEIGAITEGITERLKATEAAAVEIDDLGKSEPEGLKV